jgi:pimeloyl-ACP methyl ester carboxylesterase
VIVLTTYHCSSGRVVTNAGATLSDDCTAVSGLGQIKYQQSATQSVDSIYVFILNLDCAEHPPRQVPAANASPRCSLGELGRKRSALNRFRATDGTVLAYHASGEGTPLVLIHGTASDSARWQPVLPIFERRFTVYALDRRGYGDSGDAANYRIEAEFDDIAAMAAHINSGPVDVVAHSYGAICALGAALNAPIRRLVIYEPPLPVRPGDYYKPELPAVMREAMARNDESAAVTAFMADALKMTPQDIEAAGRLGSWTKFIGHAARILRELETVERYIGQAKFFSNCSVPTLLLLGGDSPPQYRATAEALHSVLATSRIAVIENQRHAAISAAPDLFASEVISFLAGDVPCQAD